ncbi:hypothetical protein JR316_0007735 [Psilocybe cubensis]|uniref:Uncharacterized protein n=2 Tax=Psilocybe cubensis TaxID=181762 RepID=A0A8H7XRI8_PSICU|nr:hypothetical protein JR316_0007735 [Psilocybe cubensis]KAH9479152.1 hypothetical protein JR316_0007735 [Psilocybe cubensis]
MGHANHLQTQCLLTVSSILSISILVVSILNFNTRSFILNAIGTNLALANQAFVTLKQIRSVDKLRYQGYRPAPSLITIATSALVSTIWIIALYCSVQLAVQDPQPFAEVTNPPNLSTIQGRDDTDDTPQGIFVWRKDRQVGISSLIGAELLVMGMYICLSFIQRRRVVSDSLSKQIGNMRSETGKGGNVFDIKFPAVENGDADCVKEDLDYCDEEKGAVQEVSKENSRSFLRPARRTIQLLTPAILKSRPESSWDFVTPK